MRANHCKKLFDQETYENSCNCSHLYHLLDSSVEMVTDLNLCVQIERRRLDAEEQEYQDGLRRQQIERANKTMAESQDMVKALKAKMLMCDVAHEQKAQAQMRDRKKAVDRDIEKHWVEVEKQKMSEYDEKMRAKLEQEYKLKQANAKDISEQLETYKLNYIKQLKEEMLEGELIKRQTEEDLEREKQREIQRQQKVAKMRADLATANEELMKIKEAERLKEIEEEKKIEAFALKREQLENMKKEREEKRFQEKQSTRQKMIDRQIAELQALKDNQEEVLNRQVAEAEDRANRLYEASEKRKAEMKAAIERSRQLQIQRKRNERDAKVQEDKDFAQFWKVRNEELQLAEEQEKEEERLRSKELEQFQKAQADFKNKQAVQDFQEAQVTNLKNRALQDQHEKNFYSYAEKCIKEW